MAVLGKKPAMVRSQTPSAEVRRSRGSRERAWISDRRLPVARAKRKTNLMVRKEQDSLEEMSGGEGREARYSKTRETSQSGTLGRGGEGGLSQRETADESRQCGVMTQRNTIKRTQDTSQRRSVRCDGGGGEVSYVVEENQEVREVRQRGTLGIHVVGPAPIAEGPPMRLVEALRAGAEMFGRKRRSSA